MAIDDTFAFLLGSWSFERTIVDHRAGTTGVAVGIARMGRPDPSLVSTRASYRELGCLTFGGHRGICRRHLEFVQEGALAHAFFGDGRPFVTYDLSAPVSSMSHHCAEDRYEVEIEVDSMDRFVETWSVCGPTKHYLTRSAFRRRAR